MTADPTPQKGAPFPGWKPLLKFLGSLALTIIGTALLAVDTMKHRPVACLLDLGGAMLFALITLYQWDANG